MKIEPANLVITLETPDEIAAFRVMLGHQISDGYGEWTELFNKLSDFLNKEAKS